MLQAHGFLRKVFEIFEIYETSIDMITTSEVAVSLTIDDDKNLNKILAELEKHFDVHIITQNVDNLHEKAGSTKVLHLHGELLKVRSTKNENYLLDWNGDLTIEHKDPNGFQLRPHIVWFGEDVPAIKEAIELAAQADIFIVIGTSLQVYPAAGIMHYTKPATPVFYIDPKPASVVQLANPLEIIPLSGSEGMMMLKERLLLLK